VSAFEKEDVLRMLKNGRLLPEGEKKGNTLSLERSSGQSGQKGPEGEKTFA